MPFTQHEIWRLKAELGFNLLDVGADSYAIQGIYQVFETVINENIEAEVTTTSVTPVTATIDPTPSTIVLALATGFATNDRVFVDVDDRQENFTIQNLVTTSLTGLFTKAHTGTYPVSLEGPIPLAREAMRRILETKAELETIFGEGALKQVDEIHFFDTKDSENLFGSTGATLMYWRDELASRLGVPNMWRRKAHNSAGSQMAVY